VCRLSQPARSLTGPTRPAIVTSDDCDNGIAVLSLACNPLGSPEMTDIGPNEAVWREFSAKSLAVALSWPADKLLRFTQHPKFNNLTPEDQDSIWERLKTSVAAPVATTPPAPPTRAPARPKSLRAPKKLERSTKSATAPRRAFPSRELRYAMKVAAIYWISTIAIGIVLLKLFAGG
jgi:hypothetical protein